MLSGLIKRVWHTALTVAFNTQIATRVGNTAAILFGPQRFRDHHLYLLQTPLICFIFRRI